MWTNTTRSFFPEKCLERSDACWAEQKRDDEQSYDLDVPVNLVPVAGGHLQAYDDVLARVGRSDLVGRDRRWNVSELGAGGDDENRRE